MSNCSLTTHFYMVKALPDLRRELPQYEVQFAQDHFLSSSQETADLSKQVDQAMQNLFHPNRTLNYTLHQAATHGHTILIAVIGILVIFIIVLLCKAKKAGQNLIIQNAPPAMEMANL